MVARSPASRIRSSRFREHTFHLFLLIGFAVLLAPQVCALDGHDILIHSPNITLSEDAAEYIEFSTFFDLNGDRLVWMNTWAEKKIEEKLVRNRIYLMNLSDNSTMMISETPGNRHEYSFRPPLSLSGSGIAWSEFGKNNIFYYNVTSGKETSLTSDGSAPDVQRENAFPAVDGDRVVWSKRKPYGSANDQDIMFLNLSTGVQRDICTIQGDQTEPALSGQRIVWTDMRNEPGGGDIYLYDMVTGTETPICVEKGLQMRPKISGDSVVWMDFRTGNPEVYLYNISSGQEMRISRDNFIADAPLLSGNLAVWQEYSVFDRRDERMGTIVVYDTTTGDREILPTETQYPQLLALNTNRILYANPDARTMEEGFVHLFVLDVPKPASFSPATTSLPRTAQETPTMVFGPAKTVTQSASMSPYLAPFSFLIFAMVLCIRNAYWNK